MIFGESDNDARAIAELIRALRPAGPVPVAMRSPPVYMKDADLTKAYDNADDIATAVELAALERDVVAVFVHQDCDAIEPAHVALAARIEEVLVAAGVDAGRAVTPAWEIEAWWLLWPDAVAATRTSWRRPDDWVGREVGRIPDVKEALRRAIRPREGRRDKTFPDYRESDSPAIAAKVRELGVIDAPQARSASFDAFRRKVEETL